MIPESYIEQWLAQAPWADVSMIEQDLVISRILVNMYNHPDIADALAFRGGTGLNKLFISPPARYSEDCDFVQIKAEPIGKVIDAIRSVLDSWLGVPKRKLTERSVKLIYRYVSARNIVSKVKIEINTTEHFHVEPFRYHEFKVDSAWFRGESTVKTYSINELMGTKLRALYQPRNGS